MDIREFVKDPNKLGTLLGWAVGAAAVGAMTLWMASAPPAEILPLSPAPVSEDCVNDPNQNWCEIQELFKDWSQK